MNKFIIGLILGIAIAGGLAYYLNNAPSQFVNKVTNNQTGSIAENASSPVILAPGTKYQVAASSAAVAKNNNDNNNTPNANASEPSYDFYDVLQGKKSVSNSSNAAATKASVYFIQVGSFDSQDLANDMKARLALQGIDAKIKSQQENGKMINKIIIGPFNSEDDASAVMSKLSDNDINATLIKTAN